MEKVYNHQNVEEKIYEEWEDKGYFKPEVNPAGKSYTIILPPPNANGSLHFGHAMMVLEDILIRFKRMQGRAALWLPGADHAGFETQFVFEKRLQEQGKTRFDFDRETLYHNIWDYVQENKGNMENQLKKLGFSLDWSREKFTLDPDIVKVVYATFKKMYDDGLVYRAERLVNYCTFDGTSFSDLEVVYEERKSPLYYIKYGPLTLATTRPETKFGDTAVAVHPEDKRYQKYIGKTLEIETVLGPAKIKVVADEFVNPEFGTGVVKITPAHDFDDFEVAQRHNLPLKQVIGFDGKMNEHAGKFAGLYAKQARKAIVEEMQKKGLIEKIDENYVNRVGVCYKCKNPIEPLPKEQWFIKVKPLVDKALKAVEKGEITIYPPSFENHYRQWLGNLRDWNISRQIVWGIRIPAWKNTKTGEWAVTEGKPPKGDNWEHDEDTFDTWFSSSQWPFATLMTTQAGDFEQFYPTSVMETGYDILRAWVSRMIMMGLYVTNKKPFSDVVLHGLVNDPYGKKMSKSKGNVVNPLELVEQYGADAVRFALVYGTALGHDQSLSYPKLDAMRKFTNKLWNMGRFIEMKRRELKSENKDRKENDNSINQYLQEIKNIQTLSSTEEKKLFGKLQNGDKTAVELLVKSNLELVVSIAQEYIGYGVALKQLIEEGNQGLVRAVESYKLGNKYPFSTYATWFIRQAITRSIAEQRKFGYPGEQVSRLLRVQSKLTAELGREPYPEELSDILEMDTEKVKEILDIVNVLRLSDASEDLTFADLKRIAYHDVDKDMVKKIEKLSDEITKLLDKYDFNHASQTLYEFAWHEFADKYIEDVKNRIDENSFLILNSTFLILLKLLHPFMPFVTEEINDKLGLSENMLIVSFWPDSLSL